MLKIKDQTGKVIGVLKDEDSAPELDEPEKVEGEKEDATVGGLEQSGTTSSEEGSGDES